MREGKRERESMRERKRPSAAEAPREIHVKRANVRRTEKTWNRTDPYSLKSQMNTDHSPREYLILSRINHLPHITRNAERVEEEVRERGKREIGKK